MFQRETQAPTDPEPIPATRSGGDVADAKSRKPKEIGGPKGPEPTRYGDWERNGRCIDF